ncbi:MAG TPA: hypothetical protein VFW68_03220 [Rhodocyclaceae bacterium]|nr:hypothetical protein [Rhodocyclaceae bacterium]
MTARKSAVPMRRMTHRTRSALIAKAPPPPTRDPVPLSLFDAPAVTESDIEAWCASVYCHLSLIPGSRRYAQFVHDYDVAGKIERAKSAGRFFQTIEQGRHFRDSAMMYDFLKVPKS